MPYVPVPKDLTKVKTKLAFNLPAGVFLYPRGDRQFGGCTFDDRADDALFLLRHV